MMKKFAMITVAVIMMACVGCSKANTPWLDTKDDQTSVQTEDVFNKKDLKFLSTDEEGNEVYRDSEYNEFTFNSDGLLIKTFAKPGAWSDGEILSESDLVVKAESYLNKYYGQIFDDVKLSDNQRAQSTDTNVSYILTFEREDGATFRISIWDNGVVKWSDYSEASKIASNIVGEWSDDSEFSGAENLNCRLYIYEDGMFEWTIGTDEEISMFGDDLCKFSGNLEISGNKAYLRINEGLGSILGITYDLKSEDNYLTLDKTGSEIRAYFHSNPSLIDEDRVAEFIFHKK